MHRGIVLTFTFSQVYTNAFGAKLTDTTFVFSKQQREWCDERCESVRPPPGLPAIKPIFAKTSSMKAADHIFFVLYIADWVIARCYSEKCGEVFCRFVDIVRKCFNLPLHVNDIPSIRSAIIEWLCLHELRFPKTMLPMVFHRWLKVADSLERNGPVMMHWAMPYERFLGKVLRGIKNRKDPEANAAMSYKMMKWGESGREDIIRVAERVGKHGTAQRLRDTQSLDDIGYMQTDVRKMEFRGKKSRWRVEDEVEARRLLINHYRATHPRFSFLYDLWQSTGKKVEMYRWAVPQDLEGRSALDDALSLGPVVEGDEYTRLYIADRQLRTRAMEERRKKRLATVGMYAEIDESGVSRIVRIERLIMHKFAGVYSRLVLVELYQNKKCPYTDRRIIKMNEPLRTGRMIISASMIQRRVMLLDGPYINDPEYKYVVPIHN